MSKDLYITDTDAVKQIPDDFVIQNYLEDDSLILNQKLFYNNKAFQN